MRFLYKFLVVTKAILLLTACTDNFPSKEELNIFFINFEREADTQKRRHQLMNLLKDVSDPSNQKEGDIVVYITKKASDLYLRTGDSAVVNAFDAVQIYGGFANDICGFYFNVSKSKKYLSHIKSNKSNEKALSRCVGISLSIEQYDQMIKK